MALDATAMPDYELEGQTQHYASLLTEEAITNAFRHGDAKDVSISVALARSHVILTVDDDGHGPRMQGALGTGSALISHIDGERWALDEGPDALGARLPVSIPVSWLTARTQPIVVRPSRPFCKLHEPVPLIPPACNWRNGF